LVLQERCRPVATVRLTPLLLQRLQLFVSADDDDLVILFDAPRLPGESETGVAVDADDTATLGQRQLVDGTGIVVAGDEAEHRRVVPDHRRQLQGFLAGQQVAQVTRHRLVGQHGVLEAQLVRDVLELPLVDPGNDTGEAERAPDQCGQDIGLIGLQEAEKHVGVLWLRVPEHVGRRAIAVHETGIEPFREGIDSIAIPLDDDDLVTIGEQQLRGGDGE